LELREAVLRSDKCLGVCCLATSRKILRFGSTFSPDFFFFLFLAGLGRLNTGKQALSHTSSPFCSDYFGDGGLENCLPGLASIQHSLVLSLLSS
jgi:hypothetical protein